MKKAIEIESDNSEYLNNLAASFFELKKYNKALINVDEALKIQVAAMLNIHFMCNVSMALAKSIWHLTDLDAEAIRDADIMTLQNVAHHHGILN
mgnify:CR=1 FL=1